MNISTKLESLTLSDKRECPRCGIVKNIFKDFHKGASACKECRKIEYSEKKELSMKNSDLVEIVRQLALKVEKMERAFKRQSFDLSDDEDQPNKKKKSEKVLPNTNKNTTKKKKEKTESSESSEEDIPEPKNKKKKHKDKKEKVSESSEEDIPKKEIAIKKRGRPSLKSQEPLKPIKPLKTLKR